MAVGANAKETLDLLGRLEPQIVARRAEAARVFALKCRSGSPLAKVSAAGRAS